MKFGYFTLTDNSPGYGAQRRDPNQLLLEVAEECVEAEAMGYNSAWVPEHHYGPFGASFADSRAVFDEQMEYMMAAWRQSPFEFHGTYYSTPGPLTILPRPVQQPHPEVYVACFSKPSMELAARLRVNSIFAPFAAAMLFGSVENAARESQRMARAAGLADPKVMCSYFCAVAHTHDEAERAR